MIKLRLLNLVLTFHARRPTSRRLPSQKECTAGRGTLQQVWCTSKIIDARRLARPDG